MTYIMVNYIRHEVVTVATKLTLRLDEDLIRKAKRAARTRGVSLSQMVAGYFEAVSSNNVKKGETTPVLAEISGVLRIKTDAKMILAGYRKHNEAKYR